MKYIIAWLLIACSWLPLFALPLTGNFTVSPSGNYTSIATAVSDLNTNGVGSGGVVFEVGAGSVFTGLVPVITATGTAGNPITFRKSGSGANPRIIAGAGAGTSDAIIYLSGSDYITFESIDLEENSSNVTNNERMEYGFYLTNKSVTDGASHNTIKNCRVTLNRANPNSRGIGISDNFTASSAAGACSYNRFESFAVSNCYQGILLYGTAAYPQEGNEITGTRSSQFYIGAETANDIGGSSGAVVGISGTNQKSLKIEYGTIHNLASQGNVTGLNLQSISGSVVCTNLSIHDLTTLSTSSLSQCIGMKINPVNTAGQKFSIYNNLIYKLISSYTSGSVSDLLVHGISLTNDGSTGSEIDVFYNSILISGSLNSSSTALTCSNNSGEKIIFQNNIIKNATSAQSGIAKHYCLYFQNGYAWPSEIIFSHNVYYSVNTNGYLGFCTNSYQTLPVWQSYTGQEGGSVWADPVFISAENLQIELDPNVGNAGIPLASVTLDYQGNNRNTIAPDPGAYEFNNQRPANIANPAYGQVLDTLNISLSWDVTAGYPTNFKVYLGTDSPPTNIINGITTAAYNYQVEGLPNNHRIYWQIIPCSVYEEADACPVWYFDTNYIEHTLPVELSSFTFSDTLSDTISLKWITQSESGILGYNLFECEQNNPALAQRLNFSLITREAAQVLGTQATYTYSIANIDPGEHYFWLELLEMNGLNQFYGPLYYKRNFPTDTSHSSQPMYDEFSISPNPLSFVSWVEFSLKENTSVELALYNCKGQKVKNITRGNFAKGKNKTSFETKDLQNRKLASGVYFVIMKTSQSQIIKKILILK